MTFYYFIFVLIATSSYVMFFYASTKTKNQNHSLFSPIIFMSIMLAGMSYKNSFGLAELNDYTFHTKNALPALLIVSIILLPVLIAFSNRKRRNTGLILAFIILFSTSIYAGSLVEVRINENNNQKRIEEPVS